MKVIPTVSSELPAWAQRDIDKLSNARREAFLRFVREARLRGRSERTIESYVKAIRTLGARGKPYRELTKEDLLTWQERLTSNGWSKRGKQRGDGEEKGVFQRFSVVPKL